MDHELREIKRLLATVLRNQAEIMEALKQQVTPDMAGKLEDRIIATLHRIKEGTDNG